MPTWAHVRPRQRSEPTASSVQRDGRRLDLELGPVAGLRRVDPAAHRVERTPVLGPREQRSTEQREALQPVAAEVVLPALEHGDVHLTSQRRSRNRHVLRQQLLLKRLGRGRDHDTTAGRERGHEIREALPRAGACLCEQVPTVRERPFDRVGELGLLLAGLVPIQHPGERTARSEHFTHGVELRDRDGRGTKIRSERFFSTSTPLDDRPVTVVFSSRQIRSAFGPAGFGVFCGAFRGPTSLAGNDVRRQAYRLSAHDRSGIRPRPPRRRARRLARPAPPDEHGDRVPRSVGRSAEIEQRGVPPTRGNEARRVAAGCAGALASSARRPSSSWSHR